MLQMSLMQTATLQAQPKCTDENRSDDSNLLLWDSIASHILKDSLSSFKDVDDWSFSALEHTGEIDQTIVHTWQPCSIVLSYAQQWPWSVCSRPTNGILSQSFGWSTFQTNGLIHYTTICFTSITQCELSDKWSGWPTWATYIRTWKGPWVSGPMLTDIRIPFT